MAAESSDGAASAESTSEGEPIGAFDLAARGAVALVLSVVGTVVVLEAVLAGDLVEPFDATAVQPVVLLTTLAVVGATVVYGVLTRRSPTPDRTFVRVAAIVLVLSFVPDLALLELDPEATASGVALLAFLHVVVAVICVTVLTDDYSPRSP